MLHFHQYNTNKYPVTSHHLGVLPNDELTNKLTSGMHIHFSSRDSNTGEVINLPIEKIVKRMDESFKDIICTADRNYGEYELKSHGFEYRSLPCNVDVYRVLKEAFRILRSV